MSIGAVVLVAVGDFYGCGTASVAHYPMISSNLVEGMMSTMSS